MTPGKYRHLSQCSTPAGHFNILAIDHRGNLRDSLDQQANRALTDAEFTGFKAQIIGHLLPEASAVLTDPDYGWGAVVADNKGLLAPLEVTDYSAHPSRRQTNFIEGWSVAEIKRCGGSGVKLLLYYHPKAPNASQQRDLVTQVVEQCANHDIPFFLEPISYPPDIDRPLSSSERQAVVIESAATFSALGIDVLKTEFPVDVVQEPDESIWRTALAELSAACRVPWTLLSAGTDYPTFRRQAELACQAGASGVIVGRAVWAESVILQGPAREHFLSVIAGERIRDLGAICAAYATSWREKVTPPTFAPGWYRK